jgi:hypothetical protein
LKRRQFTAEFKLEAARYVKRSRRMPIESDSDRAGDAVSCAE